MSAMLNTKTLALAIGLWAVSVGSLAGAQQEPLGGQPPPGSKASITDLQAEVAYHRAFEAVLWAMPAVSIYRFRASAFDDLGATDNTILSYSGPCTPRCELLTANNNVPYVGAYTDLRKGPVVLEVPAATSKSVMYGQIVDAWQAVLADVGPSGEDKGKGGKYLLIPPGYTKPLPDGYLKLQVPGYRISFAFRSVQLAGATQADAYAYSRLLRMYYLSEAANPPQQKFIDPIEKRYATLPFYDARFFKDLYDVVSVEPVQPRDKVMMGMLASIGIVPGKPFAPTAAMKKTMDRAAADAWFYLQKRADATFQGHPYWPTRHWANLLFPDPVNGFSYETPTSILLDDRALQFFVGTYYPKKVTTRAATMYLAPIADKNGAVLEAGKNYRLHVPGKVPVSQFWSLVVYDHATWAFIYTPQMRPGVSSLEKSKMKVNADGSVDLYFGPTAPAGLEANWIPTRGKKPYPIFRFYGPEEAFWNKSFVMPDVELVE